MYRQFLKAGQAATEGHNKKHIRSLIREGFENPTFARDPEIEIKARNTLRLLQLAGERRGIEFDLVRNLCQLKYFRDRDNLRPPLFNRRIPQQQKALHDQPRKDLELMIEMLNRDLQLCLL
ncbi:hypothetical protein A0J61_07864 [Choanephora cucurbitarum]|uniref:Uncharacterized protein n=1 Tax=Choanephora cucurbitarum TaxID=101091 RepID=A0A1C7N4P2_9FUNG|nr:hypothetical protein A0J61_07864 [Choanephora cucurbitarum]